MHSFVAISSYTVFLHVNSTPSHTQVVVPCSEVSHIVKERTAKIIPNAVGVHTIDGRNFVFGSLLSRDATFKLLNRVKRRARNMPESDSEPVGPQVLVSIIKNVETKLTEWKTAHL